MTDDQVSLGVATEITVVIIVAAMILLFAGIVVLIIVYVYIAARVLTVTVSSRGGVGTSNGVVEISTSSRMCKDDLENLPSFNYTKASSVTVDDDCAVCLDDFKVGDKCRLLPVCNHKFHAHCVDLWLLSTPLCPICRTPTTPAATITTSSVEESENQQLDNIVIELSGSAGLA